MEEAAVIGILREDVGAIVAAEHCFVAIVQAQAAFVLGGIVAFVAMGGEDRSDISDEINGRRRGFNRRRTCGPCHNGRRNRSENAANTNDLNPELHRHPILPLWDNVR